MIKSKLKESGFTTHQVLYMVIAFLLFCAIISVVFTANADGNRMAQYVRGYFERRGVPEYGELKLDGVDAIGEVPEGEIRYYINKEPVFPSGYERGSVMLQNPKSCQYALQFRVYLADGRSNMPIYTSAFLRPGQYLNGDKLNYYLSAGTYECTYTATAYDQQDVSVEYGKVSGLLTITVTN